MNRICLLPALLLAAISFEPASSRCDAAELMTPRTAARLGLEVVWTRQLRVPAGIASIVDQQIVLHPDSPKEYVEVVGEAKEGKPAPVLFRLDIDTRGPDGEPIGKEEAERLARREVRRLKRRIAEPTITTRSVPRIHLYTASSNGTIECRDAETGTPIWMSQVGNARLGYGKMGIDEKFMTITNGGNLIKIDVSNGEPINTVRTMSMPMYGAINAGEYSLIPTIRNGIEGYPLSDTTADPFMEIVAGLALTPPVKSPSSSKIAWGTDRAFVYVMETSGEPSVLFRLATDGIVSGKIAAASGDRFFFASESGQVYAIEATRTGNVLWSQPFGEPFYKSMLLSEGAVLLPSAYGNLFALDLKTGLSVWPAPAPNVDELIGSFDGKVFVRLISGSFGAIDIKTGQLVESDTSLMPQKLLINRTSNRLYLVNSVGTVQCLRAIGDELPTIRESLVVDESSDKESSEQPEKKSDPGEVDPFKNATPFGAPADPFGDPDAPVDPFGTPEMPNDPFAVPAGDAAENPFGASPF